jgi:UDP-3-O-[3-hydroxymyristoyl] glucosamine N-acyltransferase
MQFPQPIPIKEIAASIQAEIIGDDQVLALGINEIHQVRPGDITFVDVKKYFDKSLKSAASIVILNERVPAPEGKTLLLCAEPFKAYNDLVLAHRPHQPLTQAISPLANIDPTAIIEPNVVIGPYVTIGANSHLQAGVIIHEHTIIGKNVTVQSGAIIGTEAFYFKRTPEGYTKWRSGGRVILEDNSDIGPGCTINKGVSGDTIIGEGSKLDSQVHIGHDVVIGKRCLLAGQVGVGGNTILGDDVVVYGQAGIAQNLKIGDKAIISAKAGVSKDLEGGKLYFGTPASEARAAYRELAALRHLPDFLANYYK